MLQNKLQVFVAPITVYLHAMLVFFQGTVACACLRENNHNNLNVRKTHDKVREA